VRHTIDGRKRIPHRAVITVTDLVKEISGVPVVVTHELDFGDGVLEEQELMFLAQDDDGNVWHFGQLRETYDEQELVGGRVFMPGYPEAPGLGS
jgi:hypothetical protein